MGCQADQVAAIALNNNITQGGSIGAAERENRCAARRQERVHGCPTVNRDSCTCGWQKKYLWVLFVIIWCYLLFVLLVVLRN